MTDHRVGSFVGQRLPATIEQCSWLSAADQLPRGQGTYIVVLRLEVDKAIQVGRLGRFELQSGTYYYVGSAMGPGGLASRVGRHFLSGQDKKLRWHIDYLRAQMTLIGVWIWESELKIECEISKVLACHPNLSVIEKLGSSDCSCAGHVFYQHKRNQS